LVAIFNEDSAWLRRALPVAFRIDPAGGVNQI